VANPNPSPDNRFKPGNNANPGGRPKGLSIGKRLRNLLERTELGGQPLPDGKQIADILAEQLVRAAMELDAKFVREVLDRAYGTVTPAPPEGGEVEARGVLTDTAWEEARKGARKALSKRGATKPRKGQPKPADPEAPKSLLDNALNEAKKAGRKPRSRSREADKS
jgi:hypothetical protein